MKIFMSLLVAVLLMVGGQAFAKKPVDICADQEGAAHGLCNAYCEAMDCDSDSFPWLESNKACHKIYTKYVNMTGEEPPCDAINHPPGDEFCPAWTFDQLEQIGSMDLWRRYDNEKTLTGSYDGLLYYLFDGESDDILSGLHEFSDFLSIFENGYSGNMATVRHLHAGDWYGYITVCPNMEPCYIVTTKLTEVQFNACTREIVDHEMGLTSNNAVPNGGFESNTEGWLTYPPETTLTLDTEAHTGESSGKMWIESVPATGAVVYSECLSMGLPLETISWKLGLWLKTPEGSNSSAVCAISWLTSGGLPCKDSSSMLAQVVAYPNPDEWTYVSATAAIPKDTSTYSTIDVECSGDSPLTILIDDVTLVKD